MTEKTFQLMVRYGSIALGISLIFNIWVVMRNVEVYRDATRVEMQAKQMARREQILQEVVQDFAARANSDPQLAEIFRRAQRTSAPSAAPENLNQN
jgi:biopolymer transport protein ExbB/TolQ